jgi:hypothetical protein
MSTTKSKVHGSVPAPITRRDLIKRIKRDLAQQGQQLRTTRRGDFFITDSSGKRVPIDVDLAALRREWDSVGRRFERLSREGRI